MWSVVSHFVILANTIIAVSLKHTYSNVPITVVNQQGLTAGSSGVVWVPLSTQGGARPFIICLRKPAYTKV